MRLKNHARAGQRLQESGTSEPIRWVDTSTRTWRGEREEDAGQKRKKKKKKKTGGSGVETQPRVKEDSSRGACLTQGRGSRGRRRDLEMVVTARGRSGNVYLERVGARKQLGGPKGSQGREPLPP